MTARFVSLSFGLLVRGGVDNTSKSVGLDLLDRGGVANTSKSVDFGLLDRGGVDNTSKSIGCGECAGDEPAEDMMKSELSAGAEVDVLFSGLSSLAFPVRSGNLLPLGLGVGRKFFFVIWRSRSIMDGLNCR